MAREELQKDWIIRIKNEVSCMADSPAKNLEDEMEQWKKRSIYKVPSRLTDLNRKAYEPQTVSFGPYHHGAEHLMAMEEHKHRALLHFLKRSKRPLEDYVRALAEVEQDLREPYDWLDPVWRGDTPAFLQLMILDGCFMLEILRTATKTTDDYAVNDPIFSRHGNLHIMPYIRRDMLMLENQLPILVLRKLVAVENEKAKQEDDESINKLILQFWSHTTPGSSIGKCLHVLDAYRKSLLWEDESRKNHVRHKSGPKVYAGSDEIIRSATELNEAGIRFKKSKTGSLKDISFHGGVLRLPLIVVDDTTESMFLNLMAFERFHVGAGNEVTSYIFFMDNIIDNARDVSLLHSCGVIQNALGTDKAIAKLFNSISKDITLDPDSSLDVVHKNVSVYCKKRWNEWRANLIHTYFRSPWAILSVIAAGFLFGLTIVQTVYSVIDFYRQK